MERVIADYLIETPFPLADMAAMMAGEQSSGTFVRVAGETDELRARSAAEVLSIDELGEVAEPSLASANITRKGAPGPFRRARVRIAFPVGNIGKNLPTLAATVSGNLYDLGEVSGLKLLNVTIPAAYRARYPRPAQGIAGTRASLGVQGRPVFGTIIKPNVGMTPEAIASLVAELCAAGVDFIKDDEICANPDVAPLAQRVPLVMDAIKRAEDASGRRVMMAFNITDETDAMRRHADLVAEHGGTCVMASLNWCGLSAMETLRAHTPLAIHGHRNGFGAMSRHPALGMAFPAYQALYRLAGVDHMHVHGIGGKFVDSAEEVTEAARACLAPLAEGCDDAVMPAFSSGQWAGTLGSALEAAGSADLMFMCGGGILAHPGGPAAGIASLREAYEALSAGETLAQAATGRPALAAALDFFGTR
ncbi:ribulose-bisphosphate carboxylase large subunit family protein [Vannielia litorea]|uniref:ribulose-bisphosphate carboxylase large subunit family protein n=1 Tax=Vannielia litorea TaxID=1217970 RepID=UPI001C957F1A|nr:ribulose-bisphosphate carboxylase large subunit family protein [Vannielia litorea]MBY6049757.1 ribulose-bisphosphate carboxylase large subunit family protein [Vannielia litorea]MBY6077171.1 ribulose-bisphosphate carboxylase large subunit family protein [Vannielia litorea]